MSSIALVVCVAWLCWRLAQFAELRHWRGVALPVKYTPIGRAMPRRRHPRQALIDPALSLGLFIGVPYALEAPLGRTVWFAPEMTDWLLVDLGVAVGVMIARLMLSISQ